jgi:hypothetical protein
MHQPPYLVPFPTVCRPASLTLSVTGLALLRPVVTPRILAAPLSHSGLSNRRQRARASAVAQRNRAVAQPKSELSSVKVKDKVLFSQTSHRHAPKTSFRYTESVFDFVPASSSAYYSGFGCVHLCCTTPSPQHTHMDMVFVQ